MWMKVRKNRDANRAAAINSDLSLNVALKKFGLRDSGKINAPSIGISVTEDNLISTVK
jgi:hypothetical protein